MRPVVILHSVGMLTLLVGGFMIAPALISFFYGEADLPAHLISSVVTIAVGGSTWYFTREQPGPMARKESFLVVAVGWAVASVFGTLPYLLAGTFPSPLDAYFESMGGFTTTGATVLTDIDSQPHGILFWRGLTQWLGGLGIIVVFLGAMPMLKIGAEGTYALFEDEVPGPQANRITPRIRDTVKVIWVIYLAFTAVAILLLVLAGTPLYYAVTSAFGIVSSGGYSPHGSSIGHYQNPAVEWITIVFMALAGINFGLYYLIWKNKFKQVLSNTELRVYLGLMAGFSLLVAVDLIINAHYSNLLDAIRFGVFGVVAQQSGTGLVTSNFDAWPWFSKSLILFGMFIGGCSNSTCGGLKVIRLIVVFKYAHRQMYNAFRPRVVVPLKIEGKPIPDGIVRESVAFFIIYQSIFLFSCLALTALGMDFVTAISGTAATVGIVGPAFAQLGPTSNYAWVPDLGKIVFIFNMYVGRLDLWTVLILFRLSYWREP